MDGAACRPGARPPPPTGWSASSWFWPIWRSTASPTPAGTCVRASPDRGAEALDAAAGVFQHLVGGGVGHPEERRQAERLAVHGRGALRLQQLDHEVLVGGDGASG